MQLDEQPAHRCERCSALISDRFPAFDLCTPCALIENDAACAEWREQKREESRKRVAVMLAAREIEA